MSDDHNFQTCSPLKKVLNKIEDSYKTYINSYKTQAMATHHGGTGKPSQKDSGPQDNVVAIHDDYQADIMTLKTLNLTIMQA